MFRFQMHDFAHNDKFNQTYKKVSSQPIWVWGVPLLIGAVIILVPILILSTIMIITYFALNLIYKTLNAISSFFTNQSRGRKNVKVIQRPNQHQP